jgi:5-formyltetrahydrofolate cyclo-ligase
MQKSELRKIYLEKMKSQTPTEREEKSRRIAERFFDEFDLKNIKFLHLFLAIEKFGEIQTEFIFRRIWREFPHIKTVVPRVDFSENLMRSVEFTEATKLSANKWEIIEPAGDEFVESKLIDAVLVPLLCFDERGFRVGYGKGFYDKFLTTWGENTLKIGLSFFEPIRKIADVNEFDIKLDFCVMSDKIWKLN